MNKEQRAEKPRIVIVEDHPVMAEGLAGFFAGTGRWQLGGTAASLDAARELLSGMTTDVLLLDIQLKDGWGLDIIPWLEERAGHNMPLLAVYSAYDDWAHAKVALNMGVRAYISKHRTLEELEAALLTALSGSLYIDEAVQERMQNTADAFNLLTKREKEIFSLLRTGLSNKEIADRLGISHKTVKNIVSLVYDKIGLHSRMQVERL